MTSTNEPRRQLSYDEMLAVTSYLNENRDVLEGCSRETIIDSVSNGVGIKMTENNVSRIRDIKGYEWVYPRRRKANPIKAQKCEDEAYSIIASALVHLYYRLDETPPADLMKMAGEIADG